MISIDRLATALGATAALFLAGAPAGQAQAGSGPAYLVVELNVKDPDAFMEYAEKATQTISQYGGSFVVLAREAKAIEGRLGEGSPGCTTLVATRIGGILIVGGGSWVVCVR